MKRDRVRRVALVVIGLAVGLAEGSSACSDESDVATQSAAAGAGTGGSGVGGAAPGGAGGSAVVSQVCVGSPTPAPFAGTDDCPAPVPSQPDAFDDALAAGGLDRCHVRILPEDVALAGWPTKYLPDPHRLPDFTPLHRGPLRLPAYARESAHWLDAATQSTTPVSDTIAALSTRRGHRIDACVDLPTPANDDETPLATAILGLDENQGASGDEVALRAAAKLVPLELQRRLAPVVAALDHAATEVRAALGTTSKSAIRYLSRAYLLYVPSTLTWSTADDQLATLDAVDVGRIADAAALVARTIEQADLASLEDATFPPFEAATPLGPIIVHDANDDTYPGGGSAEGALLLFDLGGNDVYETAVGASDEDHPVSVAIDVRGSDTYAYAIVPDPLDDGLLPSDVRGRYTPTTPPTDGYGPVTLSETSRQGAGRAGIGLLFDLGTEGDHYASLSISQGMASMGVGVLYDAGGDDTYAAEVASQGFAVYGIAALVDRSGNDVHDAFSMSQGFGGVEGAAALVDGSGDDIYFCDPGNPAVGGHPLYYSPQLPGTGNTSMCQGAAQGRRADTPPSMAGGIGILRDASGSDHYTASVFAQGAGFWQATGLLLDGGSEPDTYDGYWYVQGATAHFALALFLEEGGNETYNATLVPADTSIGVGHDFSASLHLDEGGDDVYAGPALSFGSGNINGIGCFVNVGGDDTYVAAGDPTFGAANYSNEQPFGQPRQAAPTIGIFVDVGGTDSYEVGAEVRLLNDTTWSYDPQPYPAPQTVDTEHGCSADEAAGSVNLP